MCLQVDESILRYLAHASHWFVRVRWEAFGGKLAHKFPSASTCVRVQDDL
jgi:hypothetical protein